MRLPDTLWHGRVRTSTLGLVVLLLALLALYFSVRPLPASLVQTRETTGPGSSGTTGTTTRRSTPAPDEVEVVPVPPTGTPPEETPAEEVPAEETPAQETPAQEVPTEQPLPRAPTPEDPAPEDPAAEDPAPEDPTPGDPATTTSSPGADPVSPTTAPTPTGSP